jgi:hypothetical protein
MTTKAAFFLIIAVAGIIIIGFVLIQLLPTKAG